MDTTRKATRKGKETTLQYKSSQESLLMEELNEEQLTRLQESVSRLKKLPPGAAELECRIKLFGECKRTEDETSGQFYIRLRDWLDRNMPQTKSPLHPPRLIGQ